MNLILQKYAEKYEKLCDSYRATRSREFNESYNMESDIVRVLYSVSHIRNVILRLFKTMFLVFPFFVLGVVIGEVGRAFLAVLISPYIITKRVITDDRYGLKNIYLRIKNIVFYFKHKKELDSLRAELNKEILMPSFCDRFG